MVENKTLSSHENGDKALARDVLESTMSGMLVATMVLGIVRRAKHEYTILQYGAHGLESFSVIPLNDGLHHDTPLHLSD